MENYIEMDVRVFTALCTLLSFIGGVLIFGLKYQAGVIKELARQKDAESDARRKDLERRLSLYEKVNNIGGDA